MSGATVAVVGAGAMGGPLAQHLVEQGVRVLVFDADPARVRAIEEVGGEALTDLRAARELADWIVLSLPGPVEVAETVEEVLAGGGARAWHPRSHLERAVDEPVAARARC